MSDLPLEPHTEAEESEVEYRRCKHCKAEVREINYALGPKWMHSSYPYRTRDAHWECRATTVATPEVAR